MESLNARANAILIDPVYELLNISHQNLSLKNVIGEGIILLYASLLSPIALGTSLKSIVIYNCKIIGEFGIVYHAVVTLAHSGEKQTVAAKTVKGNILVTL